MEAAAKRRGDDVDTYLADYYGLTQETFEIVCREEAADAVRQELVLLAIADAEDIQVESDRYAELLEKTALSAGYTSGADFEALYDSEDDVIKQIRMMEALEFVADNAVITVVYE